MTNKNLMCEIKDFFESKEIPPGEALEHICHFLLSLLNYLEATDEEVEDICNNILNEYINKEKP